MIDKPPPTATIAARFSETRSRARLPDDMKAPGSLPCSAPFREAIAFERLFRE